MSDTTDLARGALNGADRLTIELVEPPDLPPIVAINWPAKPTMCTPAQRDAVVAATMKILAASVIELAALKVWKQL
jgi:hypothetical protein